MELHGVQCARWGLHGWYLIQAVTIAAAEKIRSASPAAANRASSRSTIPPNWPYTRKVRLLRNTASAQDVLPGSAPAMDIMPMDKMSMSENVAISIVVPMYNEEAVLDAFFARMIPVLDRSGLSWEIICINDGSQDRTLSILIDLHKHDGRIKVVDLSRNFGKEAALTAGLELCTGDAVIPIDADLQDPPELISDMIRKWQDGAEVVSARRTSREDDSFMKRLTAHRFYRLMNTMADIRIPDNTGDFRLMDRKVVNALKRLPERTRFMKGLFAWLGFRQDVVEYRRARRVAGESKWKYWKLWNFALEGIISFSTLPLRVWSYCGIAIAAIGFLYMAFLALQTLIAGVDVPGYASLMVAVLFLGGLQLLTLGILGEYISRMFLEVKQRPVYLVRELHGLDNPGAPGRLLEAPARHQNRAS